MVTVICALAVPAAYPRAVKVTAAVCAVIRRRKCHIRQHVLLRDISARFLLLLVQLLAHIDLARLGKAQHALPLLFVLVLAACRRDLARWQLALSLLKFESCMLLGRIVGVSARNPI